MKIRVKCPSCGTVQDIHENAPCSNCQTPLSTVGEGVIQIYRMGSPIGVAVGYGVYLDGEPMGHLANMESIRIPVSAGVHNLHMTCGMTRKCQDLQIMVNPGQFAYCKARLKPGFWTNTIVIEPSTAEEMPAE